MTANVYVIGNFKGGVGKSTCAQMLGFESATVKQRKTLIIDTDMQGNTSDVMGLTHMNFNDGAQLEYKNTINDVLMNGLPAEEAIYNIVENLDIMPADISFELYQDWVKEKYPSTLAQIEHFANMLAPLREKYDAIYLDVPPSISVYSKSAMYFAEWAIIVLQTQVKSMRNAEQYIEYMEFFTEEFNHDIKVAGIIPFMLEKSDAVDREMYALAQETYGEHLLKIVVLKNSRLKRYDGSGITIERTKTGRMKQWDKKAHELFVDILNELDEHETWYR